jgi:CheY-like chemotaxis protein
MSQTDWSKLGNKKIVLVVEDSPTQARFIQGLLRNDDIQFILALDGEMGVSMAQQLEPDVIVLDLEMPKMNGRQVFEMLRKMPETIRTPVIIFTRHNDPEFERLSVESKLVEFIPKDAFAGAVLMETLRQMGIMRPCNIPTQTH